MAKRFIFTVICFLSNARVYVCCVVVCANTDRSKPLVVLRHICPLDWERFASSYMFFLRYFVKLKRETVSIELVGAMAQNVSC